MKEEELKARRELEEKHKQARKLRRDEREDVWSNQ
jgi:hypothetical protein